MWRMSEAHLDRSTFVMDPILFRFSLSLRSLSHSSWLARLNWYGERAPRQLRKSSSLRYSSVKCMFGRGDLAR
jgi:hypothetical protein